MTDAAGNGYGVHLSYADSRLAVERRDAWTGSTLSVSAGALPTPMALGQWYTLSLTRQGGQVSAAVYLGRVDPAVSAALLSVSASDATYASFSQVNVNGGQTFDTDGVRVRSPP